MASLNDHSASSNASNTDFSESAIHPLAYEVISFLLTIIFLIGITENTLVLVIYLNNKFLHTVNNIFVIGLTLSDISQVIFGIPLVILASIAKKWIFGDPGCIYYAFVTTFLGITQITLLTAISIDRLQIIVYRNPVLSRSTQAAIITVGLCYLHGLIFALFPVFGWSSFHLEGANVSCAINWRSKAPIDVSYSLCLSVFGWVIPLIIILVSYGKITSLLRMEARKPFRRSMNRSNDSKTPRNREKRVAITVLFMIGAFVVSWMPYSIVSLWAVFGDTEDVTPTITMIPAVLAKSSIIWNPIIYVARHHDFRRACMKTLPWLKMFRSFRSVILSDTCSKTTNTGVAVVDNTSNKNTHKKEPLKQYFKLRSRKCSGNDVSDSDEGTGTTHGGASPVLKLTKVTREGGQLFVFVYPQKNDSEKVLKLLQNHRVRICSSISNDDRETSEINVEEFDIESSQYSADDVMLFDSSDKYSQSNSVLKSRDDSTNGTNVHLCRQCSKKLATNTLPKSRSNFSSIVKQLSAEEIITALTDSKETNC